MELYDASKVASYFIWDVTKRASALDHWYCAEDIACYFEALDITSYEDALKYCRLDKADIEYIDFLRNIAYRIYLRSKVDDELFNWYAAEKLIHNAEWLMALAKMAALFHELRADNSGVGELGIQSEAIKRFYMRF